MQPTTALLLLLSGLAHAAPQNRNNNNNNNNNAAAANTPFLGTTTLSTDGLSTIFTTTTTISNIPLRVQISAPLALFTTQTNLTGARAAPLSASPLGLHLLLHGDGGQSFFDFPNQADPSSASPLIGVVVLAPSENLLWGQRTGPPSGLDRPDGAADAQLLATLVSDVLPRMVAFDADNVFFTGVSGGALLLSGFFVPAHLAEFPGAKGVLLMCGALAPQVRVVGAGGFIGTSKIHFQSTKGELVSLQGAIPEAIKAYEGLAVSAGLGVGEIGALQTVDNTPAGGHCEFDGRGFVSGIQLVADNFGRIMQGGDGVVRGISRQSVLRSVVGNEDLVFDDALAKRGEGVVV
ncbi:hypothetical protein B0T18DRAFT_436946 [Schizothecium vesticola]|uniref:Phospholipase/carboxylesterase/thioesterase domain-containing protein n=1 Tax=Schizothecium vesticola TaxID=314040 RepID=A0AA40F1M1_9PEZI|nr:hypothetical protein B0T18DRAFT_436946 [Schizothecium vesticola]